MLAEREASHDALLRVTVLVGATNAPARIRMILSSPHSQRACAELRPAIRYGTKVCV